MSETENPAAVPKEHVRWLDAIRGLAALWVVGCHALATVEYDPQGAFQTVVHSLLYSGHFAVTIFIALSGFSLALQTSRLGWRLKNGYRGFLVARVIRIVPPYYAAILLSLILIRTVVGQKTGTHWDVSIPVTKSGLLKHLLLVQNFSGAPQINHAFWSVSLECQIYLFFGLVLLSLRRHGPFGAIGAGIVMSLVASLLYKILAYLFPTNFTGDESLIPYATVFCLGVASCWASVTRPALGAMWAYAIALWCGVTIAFGIAFAAMHIGQGTPALIDVAVGSAVCAGMYALATHERLSRMGSPKGLAFLGTFAYSIYLVHAPMLQVVYVMWGNLSPHSTFARSTVFSVASSSVAVGCAYVFHLAIERPCFKLRHILGRPRTQNRVAESAP